MVEKMNSVLSVYEYIVKNRTSSLPIFLIIIIYVCVYIYIIQKHYQYILPIFS